MNLVRRRRISKAVSKRIAAWAADPAQIDALLSASRRDAWEEVRTAVQRLVDTRIDMPEDEEVLRGRLDLIASIDLPALGRDAAVGRTPRNGAGPLDAT
jgi:hypothetical protein